MNSNEPKIVKPELSINKKLGNAQFDQAFDKDTIAKAENAVIKNEQAFKMGTLDDFSGLKKTFAALTPGKLSADDYEKLSKEAFSIKSRAATGGYPLVSEIANSMYQFCDKAAAKLPAGGYNGVKLHFDALCEVFDNKFPSKDAEKCQKWLKGLADISAKFLND